MTYTSVQDSELELSTRSSSWCNARIDFLQFEWSVWITSVLHAVQAYRQDCETFATVTKMLIKSVALIVINRIMFHSDNLCTAIDVLGCFLIFFGMWRDSYIW